MNQKVFLKFIERYTLEALEQAGDDVSLAAHYLQNMNQPGLIARNRAEKKAALERVRTVFSSSRERSLYIVLKSLGLDDLAKEKL